MTNNVPPGTNHTLCLGGHMSIWWGFDNVCMNLMERIEMDKR